MLTSKERAQLRAQANELETTLMVGKEGVTDAVTAEADRLLTARELIAHFRWDAIPKSNVRSVVGE